MTERKTRLGGRYELDQIIGRGGMAEVWRARDSRLERDVAVKRLRLDLASDPTFQARFRREAHSAAGLNHPNIVAVYDTGEEMDPNSEVSVPYIVMELVEGVTLRDVLRDGRKVVPERALEFTAGVLDALAYSHRAGIIHRDIKPANVMLTPSGSVKVMDFGIARAVADTSATMTQTAAVIGTAQYLSPEQARGEKVDNRSDLYSVGCLLYELLTSEPPFKGDSPVSVAYQHVREQPVPPSQVDPEVNADMDAVVLKALAKDRADRYQDAREFREDVIRVMNGQPVRAVLADTQDGLSTAVMAPAGTAAGAGLAAGRPTTPQRAVSPVHPASPVAAETDPLDDEEPRRKTGIIVLSILSAMVVVALGVALFLIYGNSEPEPVMKAVPIVLEQDEASARNTLTNEGFVPAVELRAGTADDEGEVVEQDPAGGELAEEGSTVTIWISTGEETNTIPANLVGMTEQQARSVLGDAGFTNISAQPDDPATEDINAEEGDVTAVSPSGGATEIPLSQEIVLTVATGRSIVPNFNGISQSRAQSLAEERGFVLDPIERETEEHPAGMVFDQNPSAGDAVRRGETIQVSIAVAPEKPEPDSVPRFVGIGIEDARDLAQETGYILDEVEQPTTAHAPGTVIDQSPLPGAEEPPGTTITVYVAVEAEEPDPEPTGTETDPPGDENGEGEG